MLNPPRHIAALDLSNEFQVTNTLVDGYPHLVGIDNAGK